MAGLLAKPGDLLATWAPGIGSQMIRLGAALRDEPNAANHIAICHHVDPEGTVWCLEGRPGGVGYRDATGYLNSPHTICNAAQPKTADQRAQLVAAAPKMLGTAYDWQAIIHDAGAVFGLDRVWKLKWPETGEVPGHVVCSSYAAYLYAQAGLPHPEGDREVSPADWLKLWIGRNWDGPPQ